MKLYTYCNEKECDIKCYNSGAVKLIEYTYDDYNRFIKKVKSKYIKAYHSWYETDMSDSDSGSNCKSFPINHTNIIIKDNKIYGVLIKTFGMFPKYFIFPLEKEKYAVELSGGYDSDYYEWKYENYDLESVNTYEASLKYLLIIENISYQIKDNNKEISLYLREVIGFVQSDFIVKNNKVIGLKYDNHEFIFDNPDSLRIEKTDISSYPDYSCEKYTLYKLVIIDELLLEQNIFEITYDNFKNGNYRIILK